jgi:FtsP/CotA-like multicopper oxidase with cupredoxin domain
VVAVHADHLEDFPSSSVTKAIFEGAHVEMTQVKRATRAILTRLEPGSVSRRGLLGASVAGAVAIAESHLPTFAQDTPEASPAAGMEGMDHGADADHPLTMPMMVGDVDYEANGFNPSDVLTDFDAGRVSTMANGQILHEYEITAINKEIEIVPGLTFPAWTYNGRIPGPTIRVTEGDHVKVTFINAGNHPHSMHFHGVHPAGMDGVFDEASGMVQPGGRFVYEFDAEPFGVHLYHCHTAPLAAHISRGLYGAFIIDPKEPWDPVDHEYVMVTHGYNVDFDTESNEFYAVNGIPFHYDLDRHPITFKVGEKIRIFLVNVLEYDAINSFHLHANFFHYYPTGTSRTPSEFTDTIGQMQGQRGMLEFTYKHPGRYMFHAHKTEFAELGWTGVFVVEEA